MRRSGLSLVWAVFFLFGCGQNEERTQSGLATLDENPPEPPVVMETPVPTPTPTPTPTPVPPAELINITDDSVILNPYGAAPLSAMAIFSTIVPGKIKIIVLGKHGPLSNVEHEFHDLGIVHEVPIFGLYADHENSVDIILLDYLGNELARTTVKINTGPLPANMPTSMTVDVRQDAKMATGFNLMSYHGTGIPKVPIIVDNDGEIRWLYDFASHPVLRGLGYDVGLERLKNGNFYFGDVSTDKIHETDMFGQLVNSWDLAGHIFHHNVQEKPDGNLLVTTSKIGSTHLNGTPTVEDFVIEIDRQTGAILYEWDLKQSLDENRVALRNTLANNPIDWFHDNAVIYDGSDNTIIVSGRTQGLVKLSYDNEVKWILGAHKGWGTNRRGEDLNPFLLTPLDANGIAITDPLVLNGDANHPDFEWNWFQHAPLNKPDGNIILFDNGATRNFNPAAPERYSRAVEYRIDPEAMTVQQIWAYGKERGIETFSSIVSDVDFLSNGNVLFCPGFSVLNTTGSGGKIVEIDYLTKEVVFQMSVSTANIRAFHRAERLSLYP